MEHTITTKKWYVVSGTAGDTVTSPDGSKIFCTVPEGGQGIFYATAPKVVTSNDSVEVVETTFNLAPVKLKLLGLLGGGVSTGLPSGYLVAEFLECTGAQSIYLGKCPTHIGAKAVLAYNIKSGNRHILSTGSNEFTFFRATQWSDTHVSFAGAVNGKESGGWLREQREASITKIEISQNWKMDCSWSIGREDCGYKITQNAFTTQLEETTANLNLFTYSGGSYYFNGKLFEMQISKGTDVYMDLVPVLDGSGVPCVYDKVSKKPFYNKSTTPFIVGMDMKQARKLSKLPAGGGTLKVSLPSNYLEDEGVVNALATAQENGWLITIQTYEAEAGAASTFALRRVWVRKTQDEQGSYVDSDGFRWQVEWCVDIVGSDPEQEGYEPFRSVDVAVNYWNLQPWVDPEQDEILTNNEEQ